MLGRVEVSPDSARGVTMRTKMAMAVVLCLGLDAGCEDEESGAELDAGPAEEEDPIEGSDAAAERDAATVDDERDAAVEPGPIVIDAGPLLPPPEHVDPWDNVATTFSDDVKGFAAAVCQRYVDCGMDAFVGDAAACSAWLLGSFYACDKALESVTLEGVEACTTALPDVPCTDLNAGLPRPDDCAPVYAALEQAVGIAQEDEACGDDAHCGLNLVCTTNNASCGMCARLPGPGEDCLVQCSLGPFGEDCAALCANGSFCGADDRCTARLADAASCASSDECASGYCRTDTMTCATPLADDPCDAQGYCGGSLACLGGTCSPLVALGGECSYEAPCRGLLPCVDGTCVRPELCGQAELDAPCISYTACKPGIVCSRSTGTCAALGQEGDPCGGYGPFCDFGFWCYAGTCTIDTYLPGAPCQEGASCASGRCVEGVCSAGDLGESCYLEDDCASGACAFYVCVDSHSC
jgi:hypothetical protein